MAAPPFVAQQPRWLVLSVFLFLWSLSSGFRRDGRTRALGLGVEARTHMPVADTMMDMQEEGIPVIWKRQLVGIPNCAALCASQAGDAVGCGEGLNLGCACHSPSFLPNTVTCMDNNCTSIDEQLGQQALQSACQAIGTSTTSPATTTSFSVSSTSITSGPPPICTTGSPTSASATTTVSVTVTITSSTPGSSPSSSGSGAVSATPSASSSASALPSGSASGSESASSGTTGTASVPVVTTTSMITSSSTVLLPTGSTTHPVTTVTSTSTLPGVIPTSGSGSSGTGTGGTGTGTDTNGAAESEQAAIGSAVAGLLVALGAIWAL
ncbi:hypothetical protein BV20DRAFT_1104984 [Pilatotrama ljubarskyi]|nr:hypothetical protein BV20DRAFT_1104984 [Pilatotrama ljubarskyi]